MIITVRSVKSREVLHFKVSRLWKKRLAYIYLATIAVAICYGINNYLVVAKDMIPIWFSGISIDPLNEELFKPVALLKAYKTDGRVVIYLLRTHVKPYCKKFKLIAEFHTESGHVVHRVIWRELASGQLFQHTFTIKEIEKLWGKVTEMRIIVKIDGKRVLDKIIQLQLLQRR